MGEAKRRQVAGLTWRNRTRAARAAAQPPKAETLPRPKLRELIAARNTANESMWSHRATCVECAARGAEEVGSVEGCVASEQLMERWLAADRAVTDWRIDSQIRRGVVDRFLGLAR